MDKQLNIELTQQIRNEEILMQRLNNLNIKASAWHTAAMNAFLGERNKEYKEWVAIGEEIDKLPLTNEGKLRLLVKHDLTREKVLPQHSVLLLSLLPIFGYWLAKKGITYIVTQKLERYKVEQQRIKRRQEQAKQRTERLKSKGLTD